MNGLQRGFVNEKHGLDKKSSKSLQFQGVKRAKEVDKLALAAVVPINQGQHFPRDFRVDLVNQTSNK